MKDQLAVGDKGERLFCEFYRDLEPVKSKDRAIDFHLKDGKSLELKSDDYEMSRTENFFMETLSHGKLGGPFRALQDKVDYFVYSFPRNKVYFWFSPETLCGELEKLIASNKYKIKTINNKFWTAEGYAISREVLEPFCLKVDIFP